MSPAARQVLVLTLCAAALGLLLGQLNHALSGLALTLAAPGLLVVFAALRLAPGPGLAVALLAGLCLDAAAPPALFGRQALLLGFAFCLLHRVRARLPRESRAVAVVAAIFVNLALAIVTAFAGLDQLPHPASGALRLLVDLLLSQLATALLGPWFLALQARALDLAGAPPPASRRYA